MKNLFPIIFFLALSGCQSRTSTNSSTPTVSESEIAAGSVGGSVGVTSGGQAMVLKKNQSFFANIKSSLFEDKAYASTACPTFLNNSASCGVVGSVETLTYSGCSFGGFSNVWNGSQLLTFSGGYTPSCAAPPAFANGNTMVRTWASGTAVAIPGGFTVTVDAPGGNITSSGWSTPTFDNGVTVAFTGAVARTITINGIHTLANWNGIPIFNHTISSGVMSVSAGNVITTGTVTLQHNYARYVATSTFTNVGFTAGCCFPTSGSITTTFSTGAASETLAFNSTCGSATLNGASRTLSYCF